jgi:hypothetical protein
VLPNELNRRKKIELSPISKSSGYNGSSDETE